MRLYRNVGGKTYAADIQSQVSVQESVETGSFGDPTVVHKLTVVTHNVDVTIPVGQARVQVTHDEAIENVLALLYGAIDGEIERYERTNG